MRSDAIFRMLSYNVSSDGRNRCKKFDVALLPDIVGRLSAVRWLLLCFGGICLALGLVFMFLGATPVLGFMGLEVLLLFVVYRSCVRSANMFERLYLTGRDLVFYKIDRNGNIMMLSLNHYWARVENREISGGMSRLVG